MPEFYRNTERRGTNIVSEKENSLAGLWSWVFSRYGAIAPEGRSARDGRSASTLMFLVAFVFSCGLFWWLTSFLYRVVLKVPDPVQNWTLEISYVSVALFVAGYLMPVVTLPIRIVSGKFLDIAENFSYVAVMALTIPVLAVTAICARLLSGSAYGSSVGVPFYAQAIFYPYLFFGLMFLGAVKTGESMTRKIALVCALMILPRLLITLHYGRFFAAEAIVPIAFLAVARGWVGLTKKYVLGFILLALAIIFVPSYTRGDNLTGNNALVRFFASGSNLQLFQNNVHLNLAGRCPPLLVSLTAKIVPYRHLGVCTIDYEGFRGKPATLERILTVNQVGSATDTGAGTGSNYMLELYLSGGMAVLIFGSIIFGYISKLMVYSLVNRSAFTGIWAMCLSRALFAPRGNLGYVFELVPGYVLATLVAVLFGMTIYAANQKRRSATGRKHWLENQAG